MGVRAQPLVAIRWGAVFSGTCRKTLKISAEPPAIGAAADRGKNSSNSRRSKTRLPGALQWLYNSELWLLQFFCLPLTESLLRLMPAAPGPVGRRVLRIA